MDSREYGVNFKNEFEGKSGKSKYSAFWTAPTQDSLIGLQENVKLPLRLGLPNFICSLKEK